jgi:hypothetical protein
VSYSVGSGSDLRNAALLTDVGFPIPQENSGMVNYRIIVNTVPANFVIVVPEHVDLMPSEDSS